MWTEIHTSYFINSDFLSRKKPKYKYTECKTELWKIFHCLAIEPAFLQTFYTFFPTAMLQRTDNLASTSLFISQLTLCSDLCRICSFCFIMVWFTEYISVAQWKNPSENYKNEKKSQLYHNRRLFLLEIKYVE